MKQSSTVPEFTLHPEHARKRVWVLFFLNGLLFSTWAVLVPAFQERLHLRPAELSLQLFAIMVGNLIALPLARGLLQRSGLKVTALWSLVLMGVGLATVGVVSTPLLASVALLVYGIGFGGIDFAMNAAGAWLEERLARPIMSGLHAAFSIGTLVGASLGAVLLQLNLGFTLHLTSASLLTLLAGLGIVAGLPLYRSAPPEEQRHFPLTLTLILLLMVGFAAALGEGVINDWASVYLRSHGMTLAEASRGYLLFSLTMVIGRLSGDHLTQKLGRFRLGAAASLLSAAGLILVILNPIPLMKLLGFASAGLGLSVLAPLAFSAAWAHAEARGIALMTAVFYGGFVAGPPVTGLIVEYASSSVTFVLPAVLLLLALILTTQRIYDPPKQLDELARSDFDPHTDDGT